MNSVTSKLTTRALAATVLLSACASLHAQKLLLDFGPTAVAPTEATLSMGHFGGAVPGGEISWNQIVNADNSSLIYSDGSSALGVSVVVGRADAGVTNAVNFNNKSITSSALGGSLKNGIYTNTSPIKDGIFATAVSTSGAASVSTNALGVRIDGLAAGTYTLYISGRNTSTATTVSERFFATNGPVSASFAFETNTTPNVLELNSANQNTFVYADNCAHLVVTISAGQSIYLAAAGIGAGSPAECRGFLNAVEVVAGAPVLTNFPTVISSQPANVRVYENSTVSMSAQAGGVPPLYYQWYANGAPIAGETNTSLTLANVTAATPTNYQIMVSNQVNVVVSSNALLTVVPFYNTSQMTNIWNLLPGERFYLTTIDGGERGLAYNATTTNLLVVTHVPTNNIVVLDPATGADKYFMNIDNVPGTAAGINMIGVASDGIVYTCGVTANAGSPSTPLNMIWWANDNANTAPGGFAFSGDPGAPDTGVGAVGLRWGDSLAVRGGGATAQLLCGPSSGTNVCLFTTFDGMTFTPNIITVTDVPSGFAQQGVAFGPGTNTFWAKTLNQALYLVEFDLGPKTGTVKFSATNSPPGGFRFISTDPTSKWMAGIMHVVNGQPDNVRLYNISDYTNALVLADQELYTTNVGNVFLNGAGAGSTAIGGNFVFALDMNNGIKAFVINTNTASALPSFAITSIVPMAGPAVVITWPSVSGHTYQVQALGTLTSGWADIGSPIAGTGAPLSSTNNVSGTAKFYRVKGQ